MPGLGDNQESERRFSVRNLSARVAKLSIVLLILVTAGCKAQAPAVPPASQSSIQDPALARKIEILVRGQFSIPSDYNITYGARKPSNIPGYDSLQITVGRGTRVSTTEFLITTDNSKLARLESFDLNAIPALNIPVTNRPIRGNPNAKVTVINFDDLECPYCARMHQELFPGTLERYKDKVRFIYKDDPLVEIHPWALHAAIDSNCLADQKSDAYWAYVDYLHAHGQEVTGEDHDMKKSSVTLDKIARDQAKTFSLDATKLDACLQKQEEAPVRQSMKEAENLGVEGTPYLFVDGEKINGALPTEQVWAVLDRALKAAGVEPPPPPAPASQPPPTSLTNPGTR